MEEYLHGNNVLILIARYTEPVAVVSREPVLLVGPRCSSECTSDVSLAKIKHIKAKRRRKRRARVMERQHTYIVGLTRLGWFD